MTIEGPFQPRYESSLTPHYHLILAYLTTLLEPLAVWYRGDLCLCMQKPAATDGLKAHIQSED